MGETNYRGDERRPAVKQKRLDWHVAMRPRINKYTRTQNIFASRPTSSITAKSPTFSLGMTYNKAETLV